eukprot:TRINITY_DN111630_c0_g1_i1.p1 TRINITY_DN111630_c0_g1~~TRINITY_DN111630_c0_g1_i1.p1  ORF type:complete len:532 (-),score=69.70 TRINITY_DN111630_c0_g1_i1:71-1666(-)
MAVVDTSTEKRASAVSTLIDGLEDNDLDLPLEAFDAESVAAFALIDAAEDAEDGTDSGVFHFTPDARLQSSDSPEEVQAEPLSACWMYADNRQENAYGNPANWSKKMPFLEAVEDMKASNTDFVRPVYFADYVGDTRKEQYKAGSFRELEMKSLYFQPHGQKSSNPHIWHAKVMTDDFKDPKFCMPTAQIKPRRGLPMIKVSDLLSRLKEADGQYVLEGPLNAWSGLCNLTLVSLTCKKGGLTSAITGIKKIHRLWDARQGTKAPPLPKALEIPKGTRATFWAAPGTDLGWSPTSTGFCWWYSEERDILPWCVFGEDIIDKLQEDCYASATATRAHVFAHRYPRAKSETLEQRNFWHTGLMVEWSHGKFSTIIELGWRSAVGACGICLWCEDKGKRLSQAVPSAMQVPWESTRSEVRVLDINLKSKEDLEAYMQRFSPAAGIPLKEQRFLEPVVCSSADVRLRSKTQIDIAGYALSYIRANRRYDLLAGNCQCFAADLFGFLCGLQDYQPYHPLVQAAYKSRKHAFLYIAD